MNKQNKKQRWNPFAWIVIGILVVLLAIAIPSFIRARNSSCQNACINNLRQIDSGREQGEILMKQFEQEQGLLRPKQLK